MSHRPRIVIVGGGFGGLYAARGLGRAPVQVTLVDRSNHHLFQPLLYQVATAALNPSDIAAPIRAVLRRQQNTEVLLAEAVGVDTSRKKLILTDGEIGYDQLILATGATHSYFGHDEWAKQAPGLKTIDDALEIRRRVFFAYEAAERETDPARRASWLNFVIVGAGPTGVELAGAFAEISHQALRGDFRHIDPSQARVILLEGLPRVLPVYPPDLSEKAQRQLTRLGVEVRTGARVVAIDSDGVTLAENQERIASHTVVWAAGVAASPIARSLGVPLDRAGRVIVHPDLSVPGHPDIFVIGDLAALSIDGKPVPGIAPAAIQQGRFAAENTLRTLAGKPRRVFKYNDRGMLATIGRAAAVGLIGGVKVSGWIAWWAWLLIHIAYLIGFRNRAVVLFGWAWNYLTHRRAARLITGPVPRILPGHPEERPPGD